MSYFLDPPALFLLGIILYYISKRLKWRLTTTVVMMVIISLGFFMGGSLLLYLDVLAWPLPPTSGSDWMFHTNITGIGKADVHVALAGFMLFVYPVWHVLGYLIALRLDVGSFLLRIVSFKDVKSRKLKPKTKVAVERGASPQDITRKAIESLGGLNNFVKSGDKVLIKVNISGGNPEIRGSYTSTKVVSELVKMIKEIGGKPVIVDSDMVWTKFDPVAEAEGWKTWANQAKVPLINLAETDMVRFDFGEDSVIGIVPVSKQMVEANVIISVPTMKTHLLTNVTLGMKNMYGTFPEENKAKFHRFGIENVLFEVNKAFTPNLTIIDGTIGGEAFGPLSSKPIDFETIIASNDVVAADAVASRLMGYDPLSIAHIKKAHDKRLGDAQVAFDISSLSYSKEKDQNWEKPEPLVSTFYEGLIELFLLLPGMQAFFDLAADFVLFGLATYPIFKDVTPEFERVFNTILGDILRSLTSNGFRGSRWTGDELRDLEDFIKKIMEGG
jgi:uncharacterized protein (DUF362 family)